MSSLEFITRKQTPEYMVPLNKIKEKTWNIHSKKDFLNKPFHHSDGSIFSQIRIYRDKEGVTSNVQLKLRDCYHTIDLSFGSTLDKQKEHDNALFKIDKIISHLQSFREGLIVGKEKFKEVWDQVNL